jgi:hypothetical protein
MSRPDPLAEPAAGPPDDLDPPAQLPAIIPPYALTTDAELRLVPALIAAAGWRYVEFFTANIRNLNTRRGVPLPIPADAILILPGLALA